MCMRATAVRPHHKWNWSGDELVHDPIVPNARWLRGRRGRGYDVDVRELLVSEGNAVIRREIEKLVASLEPEGKARFLARGSGCFDYRAAVISDLLGTLEYRRGTRQHDRWQTPEETLASGGGDCEDLAFVLAALLEASGISGYCVRVALGSLVDRTEKKARTFDHAWVTYLNEGGAWCLLEPTALVGQRTAQKAASKKEAITRLGRRTRQNLRDIEYVPHFVFNRQHMWRLRTAGRRAAARLPEYLERRLFWREFDPRFSTEVHDNIFDRALPELDAEQRRELKTVSLALDVNVLNYDPRDHFDFAYVPEGWQRVRERLASRSLGDFARAAHAIADFYAHSMYGHFADRRGASGPLVLYDPARPPPRDRLVYDFTPFELPGCTSADARSAADRWQGKLISGQWWRWYTTYPDELQTKAELAIRRCLPDHDVLAVDGPKPHSDQHLYGDDPAKHEEQFLLRRHAAAEHVHQAYLEWKRKA
ncbi:MAG: transglutaminase family protein [Deltaproteobacteria bacterium]|nr:transglutaminase family protein [Deltaproteobacteria bacterium]